MAEVDSKHRQENSKLKDRIDLMRGNYEAMQSNLHMNEHIRKVQQQQIIHLKGNMRVYCRIKPPFEEMSARDAHDYENRMFAYTAMKGRLLNLPQLLRDENGNVVKSPQNHLELNMPKYGGGFQAPIAFNFDHVFMPEAAQEQVFEEIKPFV